MQSIWYGKTERIFGSENERSELLRYTKKAIDFAEAIGCGNLVFGCPRNRKIAEGEDEALAINFFKEIGEYAFAHHTVVGMEANPPIYDTNFVNSTEQAIELINKVDSKGFLLNLDVGTMIENGENVEILDSNEYLINHVHISEPGLKPIKNRDIHANLNLLLKKAGYGKYVSIEMGTVEDEEVMLQAMRYVHKVFGE